MRSTAGMVVSVDEPPGPCPFCGGTMRVQKTGPRHGVTLEHGHFAARETTHVCAAGCIKDDALVTRRAQALATRLPPKGTVGYDVIVLVGLMRFVKHRQRDEIRVALQIEHGIALSTGEISHLYRRFLGYLEALHEDRAPQLRAALAADGGWPLHIDATGEDGRGTLLVAFAGWRRWVLGAWKIPTERSETILPKLRSVVDKFGAPCAVMRDLGRAMTEAAAALVVKLKRKPPVLACHQHFLKDVGKDLAGEAHDRLRDLFRRFKVKVGLRTLARDLGRALGRDIAAAREGLLEWQHGDERHVLPDGRTGLATVRALAQWVLDFHVDGEDEGFPFDRPYLDLYNRCQTACRAADAFLRRPIADAKVTKALRRLRRILDPVDADVPFKRVAATLRTRTALFTELREALRLRTKSSGKSPAAPAVLSPKQAADDLSDIQTAVDKLTADLVERRPARGPAQDERRAIDIVIAHLVDHGPSLWGHAIKLPANVGGGIRLVDRTNNAQETLFHNFKHGERRRSGRKVLSQDMEQLPAAAALALNLQREDYVAILCGTLGELPAAFATLDSRNRRRSVLVVNAAARVADATECDVVSASLPTEDRNIIRTEGMDRRIHAAARSRAPRP
ncbi:MAG: hypothetical protein AAB065_00135 [Deltaproteobacteria bacterium]